MPKFNRSQYNPSPAYIRGLVARIGLSQRLLADELGVTSRIVRYWLNDDGKVKIPYVYQFALECLAGVG